jgi:aryl-alcohol dehydrogenase-like predicted oxidoreductase
MISSENRYPLFGIMLRDRSRHVELRNLGKSGLRVSVVGLGCNNFGGRIEFDAAKAVVHKALDLGVTLFDTADTYGNRGGSEEALGRILGDRRKDIVLASKFGYPMNDSETLSGASRRYIMDEAEASLRRLKTDYFDLYQLHRPDPRTPIEETLRALDDLVRQGKARYVGCSNLPAWQVVEALWTAKHLRLNAFVSCQDEYSLVVRAPEKDLIPAMQRYGLGLLPFFPLASGLLTGKYRRNAQFPEGTRLANEQRLNDRFLTEANWAKAERLMDFCDKRGRSLLELAFSWLSRRPTVTSVIAGATRPEQVEANVQAVGWDLTPDEIAEVDRLAA